MDAVLATARISSLWYCDEKAEEMVIGLYQFQRSFSEAGARGMNPHHYHLSYMRVRNKRRILGLNLHLTDLNQHNSGDCIVLSLDMM